jgi:hypothetical protein
MDLRALIFMPALVGAVVFGFVFVLFASHYYLTVLEGTAAGGKEVAWVSEPITDNFGKLWYMLWLVGLWLGPAYLVGRVATAGDPSPWVRLGVPVLVFWLCYPVSQLASLSASTIWLPLTPDVFARLARKPGVVLGFYLLTAGVLAVFAVGFRWAFLTEEGWLYLFLGAPLMVVAGLVYARLVGRLAFVLRFTTGLFDLKRRKKPKAVAPARRGGEEPKREPVQPHDLPPLDSPDGELTGYDILTRDDDRPPPKKRIRAQVAGPDPGGAGGMPEEPPRRRKREGHRERVREWTDEDDEEPVAYSVCEAEAVPGKAAATEVVKPNAEEVRLLRRDDTPRKPKRVWGPELLAFLGQPGTASAILIASGLCFAVGVMVRVCRQFNPADGGG